MLRETRFAIIKKKYRDACNGGQGVIQGSKYGMKKVTRIEKKM
jgi:hypothetical protein